MKPTELDYGEFAGVAQTPTRDRLSETAERGRETVLHDMMGRRHASHFELVDLEDLVASFYPVGEYDPRFPRSLRRKEPPADLAAATEKDAYSLRPAEMISSVPAPQTGPPVVGPDLLVESGSRRVNMLRMRHRDGALGAYKAYLERQAPNFGISPESVKKKKTPALVRVRDSELRSWGERVRFARLANMTPETYGKAMKGVQGDTGRFAHVWDSMDSPDVDRVTTATGPSPAASEVASALEQSDFGEASGFYEHDEEGNVSISGDGKARLTVGALASVLTDPGVVFRLKEGL